MRTPVGSWPALLLGSVATLTAAGCSGGSPSSPAGAEADAALSAAPADVAAASAPDDGRRPPTSFGDPLPGLSADELARFQAGRVEFETAEEPDEGLGPVFNERSCVACHSAPATGGTSAVVETRFGTRANGRFDALAGLGGSLIQTTGIGPSGDCNFDGEIVPKEATIVSGRRTTSLFGLGLVDAVPESTFRALASEQARGSPGQAGRVAVVRDLAKGRDAVGRFGWKNQVPTLHQFAGDAYLNEMGITSPEFPDESCPQGDCALVARCNPLPGVNDAGDGVVAFQDFMTFLAPPPRGSVTASVRRGQDLFTTIGCATCHVPTLVTGRSSSRALSGVTFHPYSDFLLHRMGSLGDGIELGGAHGDEFRTAPLWGARTSTSFLHDGRAGSIAEAIRAHDGQGRAARDAFQRLPGADRQAVVDFVNSL